MAESKAAHAARADSVRDGNILSLASIGEVNNSFKSIRKHP